MKKTTQTSKFTSINNQPNPTPASSETKKHLSGFSSVTFGLGKQVRIVSLLLIALFMLSARVWGQNNAGFNNTFIILSLNGGANTYYDMNATTANTDFNGANLGTFAAGSSNLTLKGAEHNVYKCGSSDLTSTRLQYRIYLTASPSGSYTSQSIGYTSGGANGCGGQDQQWSNTGLTTNLLTGLSAGSYTIEVYSEATVTNCCGGAVYASNSGNNYKATFTVVSTFYSKAAQTNPNSLTNWTSNTDGTGINPPNFTNDNYTFIVQSGHSYTTTAAWNITGASTLRVDGTLTLSHSLVLGTGVSVGDKIGNLTINGTVNADSQHTIANTAGTFTINSGGLYKLNHPTGSNSNTTFNGIETFNSGSTFEYANYSGAVANSINYHHLVFSGATFTFPANITIGGNMTVSAGAITVNQTRTISGGLTLSGGTLTIATGNPYTLTVNGNVSITGGTLDMSSSGFSSDNGILSVKGNFTHTGGTITETGSSTASTIAINGTTAQTIESTGRSNTVLFSVAQTSATGTCSVASGKTFVNQGSTFIVTDNTSTSSDFTINGTFTRAGSSAVTFVSLTVANGGTYEHATTGAGGIPTATWSDGSTLLVSAAPSSGLTGLAQSFWNVTYNTTGTSVTESPDNSSFAVRNVFSMPSTSTVNFTLVSINNRTNSIATANIAGGTFTMTSSSNTSGLTGNVNLSGGTFNMATSAGAPTITGNVAVSGGTFNMTSAASSPGAPTITGNVTVSGGVFYAVTSTVNASATATIAGNLSVSGGTFYVTGNNNSDVHILDLNGTLDLSSSGVIEFNPVSAGTGAGRLYVSGNVSISGGTMQRTQTVTDGSTGIYFDGSTQTFTWSGGSISNAMPNRFYVNGVTTLNEVYSHGSSAQTTVNGTAGTPAVGSSAWPTSINNLTINNTSGVTLSAAKTVGGTLTFTNGILTPNGNTLTISNTSTSAISGAGAGKYVSGPLRWNLSNTNGTYVFPVGKGGNYYPFTLATTAASSPVITVESFNTDAGGTNGATISASSTTEYWSATLNSGTFTGNLSLTRSAAITTFDVIAQSSTQSGAYSSIGGTLSSPSVNSSNALSSLGFFKFATSASCADPTTQASGITFTSIGSTGMTINWSGSGNGDGVIVVMKAGSAPTDPSDNTSYTANTAFGSGTDVSSSSFVVFNGSGSSVTVTGLSASTNYFVEVFSRSCSGASIKINTTSPANSSQYTLATELAAHPASFTSSATVGGQIDLSYTAANTISNATGYIILQKSGASAPSSTPSDATSYSIGGTIGDGTVADIITDLTQTSSAITGLPASTQYSYSIIPFSYDGSNSSTYNYYTAATIRTTTATTTAAVTRYAVATGQWGSTSTWSATSGGSSGASVPTSSDIVYIEGTNTVTVAAAASCAQLNFSGTNGTVSVNSGQTLSVSGSVRVNQSGTQSNQGTISGAGTVTCGTIDVGTGAPGMTANRTTALYSTVSALTSSGAITLTCRHSGSKNDPYFYLQSGTLTATSIVTVIPGSVSGVAVFGNASGTETGTLRLTGTTPFTIDIDGTSTITLNGSGATVDYAASGAQTVRNASYTNLTLSGSGNKTLAAFSISGTLSVQGSAVGITTAPTFGVSSTLEYKNVGTRTTNAIEWPSSSGPSNLIIDNSGSTVTMVSSANRTLSGNLTLTAGTLADNGNTLTLQGNIAGTATHSGAGSITMTGASKTISGATLGNLTLNNASGFSLSGSPTINGALTFTAGKLSIGANTLNLAGTVASMSSTNNITGSTGSSISITGTGTLGTLLFDQTTAGTTNALSALTINRSSTGIVNLGSALNLAGNLTVTNGSLRSSGANTLTMAGTTQTITISNSTGGAITGTDVGSGNDLTLTIANGSATTFTGDATSSGDEDKKLFNVTVNAGGTLALSRGILCKYGTFTVNGTLQINANGYVQSTNGKAPTYGSSSSLIYNSGDSYGRGIEWSATSGAGYPNNVTVNSGTGLDLGNGGTGTMRQIAGNLILNGGLYMDFSSNDMTQALRVLGDLTIGSSGQLSLSEAVGGDIYVSGNWTRSSGGIFNPNGRAVFFTGNANTTINSSGGETFAYLIHQKTGGTFQLASTITITAPVANSNALTHGSSVDFNLNGNTINLTNGTASKILADGGARNFTGSGTINIGGGTKTVTSANSGTLSFGSAITLALSGEVNFDINISAIHGTLEINSGGFVSNSAPNYASGSILKYNSGATYGRSVEWISDFSSGIGVPVNVLVSSNTTLDLGANGNFDKESWLTGNLTLDGTLSLAASSQNEPLNISGNVVFNGGGLTLSTTAGGDIKVGGNWSGTGTFTPNSRAVFFNGTGNQSISRNDNFPYLIIDKASGTLTIAGNITLNNKLTYSGGSISFSGGSIDASGASAEVEFANSSAFTLPTGLFSNSVNKLTLNGTGGITLSENVTVTNSLKLTSGVITLGSRNLTLTGGLDATGNGNTSSYINTSGSGALIRSISTTGVDYKFPVGLSNYSPISVNFTGGTITSSSLASRAVSGLHPNATDGAYIRTNLYWEMNQTGMTNPQYNVSFTYPGVTNGTGSNETESNLLPAKWSASTGWLSSGSCSVCFNGTTMGTSSINTSTKTITWNGVSGFSDFGGFGQGNGSPLPVELSSFSASCDEDVVTLSWSTASEQNSSHFDVEKSTDGENWRVIGTVLAAGNSTQEIHYSFIDSEKSIDQNYYRLNQVDIDGKNEYFGPITVACEEDAKINTYPNPSKGEFNLVIHSKTNEKVTLKISDGNSRVISTKVLDLQNGINLFPIRENLSSGVYHIQLISESGKTTVLKHSVY
jgi:hypothetical protein